LLTHSLIQYSSDKRAEELLQRFQERDSAVQRSRLADCCPELEDTYGEEETELLPVESAQTSPVKEVVEYVVDQMGVGSESLVVKNTKAEGNGHSVIVAATPVSVAASRRHSLKLSATATPSKKHFLAQFPHHNYASVPSHYPSQTQPRFLNAPHYAFAPAADVGLAQLNVQDFNLNSDLWNPQLNPFVSECESQAVPRYAVELATTTAAAAAAVNTAVSIPTTAHIPSTIAADFFTDLNFFSYGN
jgi:hypothetical protein